MADGDLLELDGQGELNGFLFGVGTPFDTGPAGIDGLGTIIVKSMDTDLDGQDGSFAGRDFLASNVLLIPLQIREPSQADAWNALKLPQLAFAPVGTSGGDLVELHLQLPGWGHVFFNGRPRGLKVTDVSAVAVGMIDVTGEFRCLDPVMHTVTGS